MSHYRDYAYERTIVAELQRILIDRFVNSDQQPEEVLECEEVFKSESAIPQDALLRVLDKLALWEIDQRTKMNRFKWRREAGGLPFPEVPPTKMEKKNEPRVERPADKPARKRKAERAGA